MASLDVALSHRLRAYRLELSFDVAAETVASLTGSSAIRTFVDYLINRVLT